MSTPATTPQPEEKVSGAVARLNFRVNQKADFLLKKAAALEGTSVSQFVVQPALERAQKVVADAENIFLEPQDFSRVLDALANPPEPNEGMRKALVRYQTAGIQWR